jgi:hypothetical protein
MRSSEWKLITGSGAEGARGWTMMLVGTLSSGRIDLVEGIVPRVGVMKLASVLAILLCESRTILSYLPFT